MHHLKRENVTRRLAVREKHAPKQASSLQSRTGQTSAPKDPSDSSTCIHCIHYICMHVLYIYVYAHVSIHILIHISYADTYLEICRRRRFYEVVQMGIMARF